MYLLLSIVVSVLWFYFLWTRRRFYKVFWQLRGPLGLPFIGLGLQMMKPEEFLQYMQNKGEEYKTPFISWMGTKCFLYVNDPHTIETVFNSSSCINKGDLYHFMASAIGDGLFTSSAPRWNKHRRLINPSFSRKVVHSFLPIFNREANTLINKLMTLEGQPLNIYETIKRSVLEIACQTTMGKKMSFQKNGSEEIFKSYNGLTEVCVKRMLSPWLYPDVVFRNTSLFQRQQQYIDILYGFVETLLQVQKKCEKATAESFSVATDAKQRSKNSDTLDQHEYQKNMKNGGDDVENMDKIKSRVFIEQVQSHIDQGQLTWQDVRDEANVIVAATYETTSTALYFVCLCLAIHPEFQDKLFKELVEVFPSEDIEHPNKSKSQQCNVFLHEITLQHLDRMAYAEKVINEAMRLFAPVPMVLRRASYDFELNDGTLIPKGTQIGIDIFNMQRSKNIWGPCAQCFNPERHFAENYKPHPFAFIPFTKGLRMCIGYRYALILMKVILAKIFRNYTIQTDARLEDLRIKGTISLKLCNYPLCIVQRRKTFDTEKLDKI